MHSLAIGSADEMRVWLRYCRDLGYVEETQWRAWREEYQEIVKMLNGLRASWQAGAKTTRPSVF